MSIIVWMCCLFWGFFLMVDVVRGCFVFFSFDLIDVNIFELGDGCWGNFEELFFWMFYKSVKGMVILWKYRRYGKCIKVLKVW